MAIKTAPRPVKPIERIEAALMALGLPVEGAKHLAGRPHSGKKVVSLRLDPDVIAKFRATGPGWQARINEILRDYAL